MTNSTITLQDPDKIRTTLVSPTVLITTISATDSTLVLPTSANLHSEIETSQIKSVLANAQGPAGPPCANTEEEMKTGKRIDFVGDSVIYKGEAEPGSSESDAVWRISKITFVDEDATEQWAEGNAKFDKAWSSRLSYNYY